MVYLILFGIAAIMLCFLLKFILSCFFSFIQIFFLAMGSLISHYKYLCFSVLIVLFVWGYYGGKKAQIAFLMVIAIRILIAMLKKADLFFRRLNVKKFLNWLEKNGENRGQISVEDFPIPNKYKICRYPQNTTYSIILASFLENCEKQLKEILPQYIYSIVKEAGMGFTGEFYENAVLEFENYTRLNSLDILFYESVDKLKEDGCIDQPDIDGQTLHCVGSEMGTNFESQEIAFDDL